MNEHWYGVVLAGGVGTRLWPKSRQDMPKQFLRLQGELTMLQATMQRLEGLIPPERRYVVTGRAYADLVAEQLPDMPREQILAEPVGRNTAPPIGWVASVIAARDPDAVMCSLASDHVVRDVERFRACLRASMQHAEDTGSLMTIGITPTHPETGFGYIHVGETVGEYGGVRVRGVHGFVEKPDRPTAEEYVASGNYYWNASMFAWRTDAILSALREHAPDVASLLTKLGAETAGELLESVFAEMPSIAIDHAVMERAANVATVPGDFGWDDIGSWAALGEYWLADENDNRVHEARVVAVDSRGNIVHGADRIIALVGVEDLVVVDTPDAVLICHKDAAVDVREIVAKLKSEGDTHLT